MKTYNPNLNLACYASHQHRSSCPRAQKERDARPIRRDAGAIQPRLERTRVVARGVLHSTVVSGGGLRERHIPTKREKKRASGGTRPLEHLIIACFKITLLSNTPTPPRIGSCQHKKSWSSTSSYFACRVVQFSKNMKCRWTERSHGICE